LVATSLLQSQEIQYSTIPWNCVSSWQLRWQRRWLQWLEGSTINK